MRYLSALFLFIPVAALAHDGLHLHPHGIGYGWVIAAALCGAGGYALARVGTRRRK